MGLTFLSNLIISAFKLVCFDQLHFMWLNTSLSLNLLSFLMSFLLIIIYSVLHWLWFIEFSDYELAVFSCFFAWLVIFGWISDLNFYLLECCMFVHFYKYSWDLSWDIVKFDLLTLPFQICRWTRVMFSLGLIILYHEARPFCVLYPVPGELWRFPVLLVGTDTVSCVSVVYSL